jgi:hypothetical protein
MRTSHPECRTPTIRQFVMVMAAVTWFAILLPVGARAAGQLVTIVDPTTSARARVVTPGALRVAEYNDPARQPFVGYVTVALDAGQLGESDVVTTVPAGHRLVIDTVTVHVKVPTGQRATYLYVSASGPVLYIPLSFAGSYSGLDHYQGLGQVQMYADPSKIMYATWQRSFTSGAASASFGISGHFVRL